ncbi:putative toxin-antitoxin system toxin component, PIN family [Candidatus Poribacteria bacterium]|nr:putative toxin-antitoxin system toxin component, PIN family [Candidatus Poribacteria bacterium]
MKSTNTDKKNEKCVVPDTNVLVSGLLWTGPPHEVIEMAERGEIELYTASEILDELEDVLGREKFQRRITVLATTVEALMNRAQLLMNIVEIELPSEPMVPEDPDDDMFLVCAQTANASLIISGDSHLLNMGRFGDIEILSVVEALNRLKS